MACSPPARPVLSQNYGTTGRNSARFFQPPKSPALVATSPSWAISTHYSQPASKKRQRPDSSHTREGKHASQTPWKETPSWAQHLPASDTLLESGYDQQSELVNDRYRLAGGFDTPSLPSTRRLEQLTVPENDFRRRLRDDDMDIPLGAGCTPLSGPLARERNGIARIKSVPNDHKQASWTSLAINIVEKVFSFGGTVFRGFTAGGGIGYAHGQQNSALVGTDLLQYSARRNVTPLPGSWQDGGLKQDSPSFSQQTTTLPNRPAAKRRQTDRDSWVMVDTPKTAKAPASPRHKASNTHNVPRSNLSPLRSSTSRASGRKSIAPATRRHTPNNSDTGSIPLQIPLPGTPRTPHRLVSIAPARSPQVQASPNGMSSEYMSPEVQRFAKRQARQDKTMTNMGNRIQEMMRQAQEALGTKYSVECGVDDDMGAEDDDFVDDEW